MEIIKYTRDIVFARQEMFLTLNLTKNVIVQFDIFGYFFVLYLDIFVSGKH